VANGVVTRFPIANGPAGLAIGPTGTIWVATTTDGKLYRLNPDASQAGVTTLIPGTSAVAADPTTGAVWIGEQATNGASKVKPDGTLVGHFPAATFPAGVAIDGHHHVWVAGNIGNNGFLSELAP
jgi:streptogramin lyase